MQKMQEHFSALHRLKRLLLVPYYTPSLAFELPASPHGWGIRRSSTGIPHTLKSAKLLKLGIAGIFRARANASNS